MFIKNKFKINFVINNFMLFCLMFLFAGMLGFLITYNLLLPSEYISILSFSLGFFESAFLTPCFFLLFLFSRK